MNINIQAFVKRANEEAKKAKKAKNDKNIESTPLTEGLMGVVPSAALSSVGLGGLDRLASLGGTIAGYSSPLTDTPPAVALAPGGRGYLWAQRMKKQIQNQGERAAKRGLKDRATSNLVSEHLGGISSTFLPMALGALTGGIAGSRYAGKDTDRTQSALRGSIFGALAGLGISVSGRAVGAIAAAIKRRRTAEEQMQHDTTHSAYNWFIPGASTYNYYKRLGRSQGDLEEGLYDHK